MNKNTCLTHTTFLKVEVDVKLSTPPKAGQGDSPQLNLSVG